MARFRKQATTNLTPREAALDLLVREAKEEGALAGEVAKATRQTYEAKAKQLAEGWDLASACKKSRYSMRAAGLWTMRRRLRALVKDAEKAKKSGVTGAELFPVREAIFREKMEKVGQLLAAIREFSALPWAEIDDPGRRLQDSHKQRPATDAELVKFYEAAADSSFYEAFLVAEFSGCRGAEFGSGIRVELGKKVGIPTLTFFTQSAKADGKKKGLDLRAVDVPFPTNAAEYVKRRWLDLAKRVKPGKSHVVAIAPTEKMTAGQRFTNACKFVAIKAGVETAAYSLRHRFAAQVKQANKGDAVAVALALGHQSTETQRHYARSKRGGGDVSPVQVNAFNVSGQKVRGAPARTGPPLHVVQKAVLQSAIAAMPPPRMRGPRL